MKAEQLISQYLEAKGPKTLKDIEKSLGLKSGEIQKRLQKHAKTVAKGESAVHRNDADLVRAAGDWWATSNLGMLPEKGENWREAAETDEMYDSLVGEFKYWEKEAKKALPKLKKSGLPQSIENLWKFVK